MSCYQLFWMVWKRSFVHPFNGNSVNVLSLLGRNRTSARSEEKYLLDRVFLNFIFWSKNAILVDVVLFRGTVESWPNCWVIGRALEMKKNISVGSSRLKFYFFEAKKQLLLTLFYSGVRMCQHWLVWTFWTFGSRRSVQLSRRNAVFLDEGSLKKRYNSCTFECGSAADRAPQGKNRAHIYTAAKFAFPANFHFSAGAHKNALGIHMMVPSLA